MLAVLRAGGRAIVQQPLYHLAVPSKASYVKSVFLAPAARTPHHCTLVQQQLHHLIMSSPACNVQGSPLFVLCGVDLGAMLQQDIGGGCSPTMAGNV